MAYQDAVGVVPPKGLDNGPGASTLDVEGAATGSQAVNNPPASSVVGKGAK